jgi:hypothetical protein
MGYVVVRTGTTTPVNMPDQSTSEHGNWKINPANPLLYRMTRIELVEPILRLGRLSAPSSRDIPEYDSYPLGKPNMIEKRNTKEVSVQPSGTLQDYVAFYFAPRSPMLYSIKNNVSDGVSCSQAQIIYWVTCFDKLQSARWVFTDRNATTNYVNYYNSVDDFNKIDFELMKAKYWKDIPEDRTRKERRAAEFLVFESIPVSSFLGLAAMNDTQRDNLQALVDKYKLSLHVATRPDWYF